MHIMHSDCINALASVQREDQWQIFYISREFFQQTIITKLLFVHHISLSQLLQIDVMHMVDWFTLKIFRFYITSQQDIGTLRMTKIPSLEHQSSGSVRGQGYYLATLQLKRDFVSHVKKLKQQPHDYYTQWRTCLSSWPLSNANNSGFRILRTH